VNCACVSYHSIAPCGRGLSRRRGQSRSERGHVTSEQSDEKAAVIAVIERYRPRGVRLDVWSKIRPLVIDVVRACRPKTRQEARSILCVTAQLVAWADHVMLPLDVEEIFVPDVVERFMANAYRGSKDPATVRARLRSVGRTVTVRAPWPQHSDRYPRTPLTPPYSARELESLWTDAHNQRTEHRRIIFEKLLRIGLGVGASATEAARVRGLDFAQTPEGLVAILGPGRREVPVRVAHADALAMFSSEAKDDFIIPGKIERNKINSRIRDLEFSTRTPALRIGRLRTSWAVSLLNEGVPITEVMRAMGVTSVDIFRDLLRFVHPWSDREFRLVISGRVPNR
jgi:hypothetical protein